MTGKTTLFLLPGVIVLICMLAYYWGNRDMVEQVAGSNELDCAVIEHQWSLRAGEDALYAMQDAAMSAIEEGRADIASCTLELAVSRAWKSRNDTLAYRFATNLADFYVQDGQFERARSALMSVLTHLGKDSETNRIRRVETYLQLISVSNSAGDENSVSHYIAQAREESKDLIMGMLVKDRLFLAEIEHFESERNYGLAARSAKDLLELRREWNEQMPTQIDSEYVQAAREEYERLKQLRDQ